MRKAFAILRTRLLSWKLKLALFAAIGNNLQMIKPRLIRCPKGTLYIGNDFFSGPGLYVSINKYCKLKMGNAIMLGPDVMILGGNHNYSYSAGHLRYYGEDDKNTKDIIIEDGAWVGARSIILSGAQISEGVVVGAGSVVNKYLPPYTIAAGNPVKVRKLRFSDAKELEKILVSLGSKYSLEKVLEIYKKYDIHLSES